MQQNLPYKLDQKVVLPLIDLLDKTELAFSHAFLQAAHTLHSYLQEIQSVALVIGSDTEPYTVAIISLFAKLIRSYYSYVLLEIHRDRIGSQFLIEELCATAVTLTYLLETADREIFADYVAASVRQARTLLQEVETQLLQVPNKLELLVLRDRLEAFIAEQKQPKQPTSQHQLANLAADIWGMETANTTAKRAALLGLDFLNNPARQIAQKIAPASWLDVKLNHGNYATNGLQISNSQKIDFQQLRDASHLCLHATRTLLLEVAQSLDADRAEIQQRQQDLNRFFEWFYQAYQAYSGGSDASIKSNKNGDRDRS
jgi:hypothetical protein